MDYVKKFSGGSDHHNSNVSNDNVSQDKQSGGFLSSLKNKMEKGAGGGRESEKNEDYLDKGMESVCLVFSFRASLIIIFLQVSICSKKRFLVKANKIMRVQ